MNIRPTLSYSTPLAAPNHSSATDFDKTSAHAPPCPSPYASAGTPSSIPVNCLTPTPASGPIHAAAAAPGIAATVALPAAVAPAAVAAGFGNSDAIVSSFTSDASNSTLSSLATFSDASSSDAPVSSSPWPVRCDLIERIGDWTLGATLGQGGCGLVRLATRDDGRRAACKILPAINDETLPSLLDDDARAASYRSRLELLILKAVSGMRFPNFVWLEEVITKEPYTFLFLTLARGDLYGVQLNAETQREQVAALFRRIAIAVFQLHSIGIAHEDLKPPNILIDFDGQPLLTDFGLSDFSPWLSLTTYNGGTARYTSPEKTECQQNRDPNVYTAYNGRISDIWSLGIMLMELVGIKHPWTDTDDSSIGIEDRLLDVSLDWTPPQWTEQSGLGHLLKRLLERAPTERITIPQLLQHPYLRCSIPDPPFYAAWERLSLRTPGISVKKLRDLDFMALSINRQSLFQPSGGRDRRTQVYHILPTWEQTWVGMWLSWERTYCAPRVPMPIDNSHPRQGWIPPQYQAYFLRSLQELTRKRRRLTLLPPRSPQEYATQDAVESDEGPDQPATPDAPRDLPTGAHASDSSTHTPRFGAPGRPAPKRAAPPMSAQACRRSVRRRHDEHSGESDGGDEYDADDVEDDGEPRPREVPHNRAGT